MRSVLITIASLSLASGALRGQTREYSSASATITSHPKSKLSLRLATANDELNQLLKEDDHINNNKNPSLVELSLQRPGQGTPKTTNAAKSIYHADAQEEKSLKQIPLPPPRFLSAGAKVIPSVAGGSNPYSQGNVYGRGYQDSMTPMTGTYANNYGPASGGPMGTQGYGSFPSQVDPRGFGGTYNYSTPYSSFFGPFTGKGVSSQGFKYQVPYSNVHPMAPYSGNPFTAAYGPGGPYYQQGAGDASTTTQPTLQNYTQFGPHPFGPYGTMNTAPSQNAGGMSSRGGSMIPASYPMGQSATPAGPMGPAGAMGGMMGGPFLGSVGQQGMLGQQGTNGMMPGMMGGMMGQPTQPQFNGPNGQNGQPQFNPAYGMGMIPHMNAGNMFNPAFPAGNPGNDPRSVGQGMQHAWAMGMPGVGPTYNPNMAMHHGLNLPGGMGQFHDPPMAHGFGQGYPMPDQDRYSSVYESIPAPGGSEAAAALL